MAFRPYLISRPAAAPRLAAAGRAVEETESLITERSNS
jgi:hypothetical protein